MPNAGKPLTRLIGTAWAQTRRPRSDPSLPSAAASGNPACRTGRRGRQVGVQSVYLKNEALRINSGSFKSLGGAYAVMVMFKKLLETELGEEVRIAQLVSPPRARSPDP